MSHVNPEKLMKMDAEKIAKWIVDHPTLCSGEDTLADLLAVMFRRIGDLEKDQANLKSRTWNP